MSAQASPDSPVYMLTAARWWASLGLPVFPLHYPVPGEDGLVCSCHKDCPSPAKHPLTVNGFEDATTDLDTIDRWWHRHPHANIGIRMGVVVDLLDVDGEAGFASLADLTAQLGGEPLALLTAESGRAGGGRHYYVQPAGKKSLQGGRKGVPAGLDVKGAGGYAVAAPSQHISGNRYRLISQTPTGTVDWDTVYAALTANKPEPAAERNYQPDPFNTTTLVAGSDGDTAYGLKAIAGMCEEMRAQRQPGRDTLLNDLCVRAGTLIRDEKLTRGTAEHELRQAAYSVTDSSFTREQVDEKLQRSISDGIAGSYQIKYGPKPTGPRAFTQAESDETDWPTPRPLELERPPFPVHTLGPLEAPVALLAEHLQTPVDLVAMMTLATLGATVRGRLRVRVRDSWTEPLNLYVLVLAGAGETKSPVLAHVTRGLRDIEKRDQEAARAEVRKYEQQKRLLEGRLAKAEKAAIAATADARYSAEIDADMARQALDELAPVVSPRYLAGDLTAEALVRLLAEQGGALASLSAEGGLFDTLAGGRYSGGMANLDAVLQAHDGREPIQVDRKGSEPLRVEQPCLTLGLAVQPQVLQQAGKSEAAEGRGFFARFLFSYPESRVGGRRMSARIPLEQGFADIAGVIEGVDALIGSSIADIAGVSPRADFSLSSLSIKTLEAYLTALEPRRHPMYGDLAGIGAWANKLDGQIARLAGLLSLNRQALRNTPAISAELEPVSVEDVEAACQIADYLIGHATLAHRVLRGQSLATSTTAVQLLGWVRAHGQAEFTVRDAHDSLRHRVDFTNAETVHAAALVLAEAGYLRQIVPDKNPPGRPTTRYLVNPSELQP